MLKSIDVLIGLVVVLLALSMAVTVITQTITTIVNSRGRHLRRGLIDLLHQIDPALAAGDLSAKIATHILEHPLVSASTLPFAAGSGWRRLFGGARLGNVIHREEFTKMVIGLASGDSTLDAAARDTLTQALSRNGISDPDTTLRAVRAIALQLEKSAPELSNAARQTAATLHAADSDFLAKIHAWFDQTMDRTSQRFTASTRVITFAGAFIVAFGLQVDTPLVFNRLQADDAFREALVKQAQQIDPQKPDEFDKNYRAMLSEAGVIKLPSVTDWGKCSLSSNGVDLSCFAGRTFGGMLLTALLLSLGAPFWYSALGNLLQLRSLLAAKDDAQRKERQTETPPAGAAAPASGSTAAAIGERGDLNAVG